MKQNSIIIPLKGIDRSTSDPLSENGAMDEVINLRHVNGSLTPLGEYQTLKDTFGSDIDVSAYDLVFLHKTNIFEHFIVLQDGTLYYLNDNIKEDIENFPSGLNIPSDVSLSYNGNIIDVSYFQNDDIINFYLFWNGEKYIYMDLDFIVPLVELRRTARDDLTYSFYSETIFNIGTTNEIRDAKERRFSALKGYINESAYNMQAAGNICGSFSWMYAIKLYDGTYIKTSPLFFCTQLDPKNRNYANYDNPDYNNYSFFQYFGATDERYYSDTQAIYKVKAQLLGCKPDVIFNSLKKLKPVKDIILSIDLFISSPIIPIRQDDNLNLLMQTPFPYLKTDDELTKEYEKKSPLFKFASFELDDLDLDLEGTPQVKLVTDFDFNNLTLGEAWNSDFDNYAKMISVVSYLYNNKIHKADITSKLANIFPFKYYQDQPIRFDKKDGTYTYETPASSKRISNFSTLSQLLVRVLLKTSNGDASTACVRYFSINGNEFLAYDGTYINKISVLLSYPDIRAYRMQIVLTYNDGTTNGTIIDVPLKPHPYFNLAYYLADGLRPIDYPTDYEIFNIDWFTPKNLISKSPNIIKVSETDNIFVYPSENTYTVGAGKILGLCSNTKAISTGQFGEYPLYAFCSDGIFALGLGSEDVDYASIRPVSRDVCNNPDSIIPIDNAVVFSTNRGLLMISGEQITELSKFVEGNPFNFKSGISTINLLNQALDNDNLVRLSGSISSVDFNEYLKEAKIGFIYNHNRELIVSNSDYAYSYIFSFVSQAWTKVDFVPGKFMANYPLLYGIFGGKIFNITDEKTDVAKETFFLTRPIKVNGQNYIRPVRIILRSLIKPNKYSGLYVFGSVDGLTWRFIGGREYNGKLSHSDNLNDFAHIGCDASREKIRYIRIAFAGNVKYDTKLDYLEVYALPTIDNSN
ncbi:hypothetical protein [Dysgonomonas termitidis]|uniref:Stabilization protein n=1 Tax=Dysgonomonas termitidis TaxID=1516126 RepID=A0ABV9KPN3_9BACT